MCDFFYSVSVKMTSMHWIKTKKTWWSVAIHRSSDVMISLKISNLRQLQTDNNFSLCFSTFFYLALLYGNLRKLSWSLFKLPFLFVAFCHKMCQGSRSPGNCYGYETATAAIIVKFDWMGTRCHYLLSPSTHCSPLEWFLTTLTTCRLAGSFQSRQGVERPNAQNETDRTAFGRKV